MCLKNILCWTHSLFFFRTRASDFREIYDLPVSIPTHSCRPGMRGEAEAQGLGTWPQRSKRVVDGQRVDEAKENQNESRAITIVKSRFSGIRALGEFRHICFYYLFRPPEVKIIFLK